MEIFIKVAPRDYESLRRQIPGNSPARLAIDKATPIDYFVGGVQFEGYNIPCEENQALTILEIARQHCPAIVREIQAAIRLANRAENKV